MSSGKKSCDMFQGYCFQLPTTVLCEWPMLPGTSDKTQHALTDNPTHFLILPMSWAGDLLIHEQKFCLNVWFARGVTTGWMFDTTTIFTLVVLSLTKQRNFSYAASQLSQYKHTESVTIAQLISNNFLYHISLLIHLTPQWGQFDLPVLLFPP